MAETSEGKTVIVINVCGGVYGEWHNWGSIDNDPDKGETMTSYFQFGCWMPKPVKFI